MRILPTRRIYKYIDNSMGDNCVLLCHLNSDFTDSGPHGMTPTASGVSISGVYKKFGAGEALFNGDTDYLQFPDHASFNFAANLFSVDCWIRFNLANHSPQMIWRTDSGGSSPRIELYYMSTGALQGYFKFYSTDGTDTCTVQTGNISIVLNQYYHIAAIRGWGGNPDRVAITWDGQAQATGLWNGTNAPNCTGPFVIGNSRAGNNDAFDGGIDEFRVTRYGPSKWTNNFIPLTEEYA